MPLLYFTIVAPSLRGHLHQPGGDGADVESRPIVGVELDLEYKTGAASW